MSRRRLLRASLGAEAPIKALLPPEYQQVEWIETPQTRDAFIATSYIPNQDSEIEFKCCAATAAGGTNIIYSKKMGFGLKTGATYGFIFNTEASEATDLTQPDFNELVTVKLSKDGFFVNGVRASNAISQQDWTDTAPILIFAYLNFIQSGVRGAELIIREKGVEELHLISCYHKSSITVGMYDLCGTICPNTGTPFYTSSGKGTFLKGADV